MVIEHVLDGLFGNGVVGFLLRRVSVEYLVEREVLWLFAFLGARRSEAPLVAVE